jgi:large subunit ribosomal protein L23
MATKKTKPNKAPEVKDSLVLGPRMTEKSAILSEKGVYTFNVKDEANKSEILKAIKALYKVTPVKISITQIAEKAVMRRGIPGVKRGGKKAVVYLKKGDKIAFT